MNRKRFISVVLTGAFLVGGIAPGIANTEPPQMEVIPIMAPINNVISAPVPVTVELTDIEGHWAHKDIITMVEKGIIEVSDGKFQPEKIITQGDFLYGLKQVFKEYSVPEINPEEGKTYITRMEAAKAIEKTFVDNEIPVMMTLMFPVYDDTVDLTPEESSALSFVFNTGIMKGKTENNFCPADPLTKAELAVVLNRTMNVLEIATHNFQDYEEIKEDKIITINGIVSEVNYDGRNLINILVENSSEDNKAYDKVYFLIAPETRIIKGEMETKEIEKGDKVSVEYVDGPITKIYPARIEAKLIKVLE